MPYAYIGAEAVGPKCAADIGLIPSKAKKGGKVIFVKQDARRQESPEQPDLFDGV